MRHYSFGLVSYLNTSPFRYGLQELGQRRWINDVPSRLLPLLESGRVDAAILPSLDVLSHPELPVLAGSCISCCGPADSVKLFAKIPLSQATTVALDRSSHTSAALTRIVLSSKGCRPAFVTMEPDLTAMLAAADAALLIGDPCMRADATGLLAFDLGEEWLALTGLPFVFALWAARPGLDNRELSALIAEAKRIGLAQVEEVAAEESARLGLPREQCLLYLRDHMRYDLDDSTRAGLERYRRLAAEERLIPDVGPVSVP